MRAEEQYFPLVAWFAKVKVLESSDFHHPSASSSQRWSQHFIVLLPETHVLFLSLSTYLPLAAKSAKLFCPTPPFPTYTQSRKANLFSILLFFSFTLTYIVFFLLLSWTFCCNSLFPPSSSTARIFIDPWTGLTCCLVTYGEENK